MNSYELSRCFIDWSFENPEKVKPIHYAIYFFAIEHCNRLGWKDKFGLPSQMVMEAIGVKNWRTYSAGLNELVDFGFIKMIEISKNQYSSNIIAIVKNTKAPTKADTKALDKALSKHGAKQRQSTVSIDKQLNNTTTNNTTINNKEVKENKLILFDSWWNQYEYKHDSGKCKELWCKLSFEEINKILEVVSNYVKSTPDKTYRLKPLNYLKREAWNNEIIFKTNNNGAITDNRTEQQKLADAVEHTQQRAREIGEFGIFGIQQG